MTAIRPNRVKQKLANNEVAIVLGGVNDADTIDLLGPLGFDGFWLEGEHGPVDFADIADLSRACDIWGATSILRVHQNEYGVIYRALDRGAMGIVVPHVNTRAEVENVVEAGKFAPIGKRGMFTSRQGYGVADYFDRANDQTMMVVLIEDIAAVNNLDDIIKVDHIDCFFVAPSDLATSMGKMGKLNDPEVQKTLDGALEKIVKAGRVAGTLANDDNVEHYTRLGVRMIMTSAAPWIAAGAKNFAARAQAGART